MKNNLCSLTVLCFFLFALIGCDNEPKQDSTATETEMTQTDTLQEPFFKLSLAQWSLHKALFAEEMSNLDFPRKAKELGFDGVEWVAHFFTDKAGDQAYLQQMKDSTDAAGVKNLIIMIDGKGDLAVNNKKERDAAVEAHKVWVDAAKFLGCHSVRVNLFGDGTPEEWHAAATDGLGRLAKYGQEQGINVIVENHGGLSSDSKKLVAVIEEVGADNVGTLPDFGNFCIAREGGGRWEGKCIEEYDRYRGTKEMMPYAKAVSAKSYDFDAEGKETKIDFGKMLRIVKEHNYDGYIGVEYEGENLGETDGIIRTRDLLLAEARKM